MVCFHSDYKWLPYDLMENGFARKATGPTVLGPSSRTIPQRGPRSKLQNYTTRADVGFNENDSESDGADIGFLKYDLILKSHLISMDSILSSKTERNYKKN